MNRGLIVEEEFETTPFLLDDEQARRYEQRLGRFLAWIWDLVEGQGRNPAHITSIRHDLLPGAAGRPKDTMVKAVVRVLISQRKPMGPLKNCRPVQPEQHECILLP